MFCIFVQNIFYMEIKIINTLKEADWIRALEAKGKVHLVGGLVRDHFLGKESKDVDLLVTGMTLKEIAEVIRPFGKLDEVGESFAVIKFTPKGWKMGEPVDIAVPRLEENTGDGHQDVEVTTGEHITVEDDLLRRDFTINSIAVSLDGTIIDPFDGIKDIEAKTIRMTNPDAFGDDPLRMLRAIQFAARFDFNIDSTTWEQIVENKSKIKKVSGERILIEFDKIFKKGDIQKGIQLWMDSGLSKEYFNAEIPFGIDVKETMNEIETWGDMLMVICGGRPDRFKKRLKGDASTFKEMNAIAFCFAQVAALGPLLMSEPHHRLIAFDMFKMSEASHQSGIIPGIIKRAIIDLNTDTYPLSQKELAITGNDLLPLGIKGKNIRHVFDLTLFGIFQDKFPNDKDVILELIKRKKIS